MPAPALTPLDVSDAFWAMGEHCKTLLEVGALNGETTGVVHWDVQMLPTYAVITFERTTDGLVAISWTTVDPDARAEVLNEVHMRPKAFNLVFAGAQPQ